MSLKERRRRNEAICRRLLGEPALCRAGTILFYKALPDEAEFDGVIIWALAAGKRVLLPRSLTARHELELAQIRDPREDLAPGAYGILEPRPDSPNVSYGEVEVACLPARAFDRERFRLGRGAGYYDRFLADPAFKGSSVGIVFACQIVERVPRGEHDRAADIVLTEEETF
jgi:5-formyltetrahydrofolate cyclo-ligase